MFGKPILRPHNATVLLWVWNYMMKEDPLTGKPIYKAQGTCNGGKRCGKAGSLWRRHTLHASNNLRAAFTGV